MGDEPFRTEAGTDKLSEPAADTPRARDEGTAAEEIGRVTGETDRPVEMDAGDAEENNDGDGGEGDGERPDGFVEGDGDRDGERARLLVFRV